MNETGQVGMLHRGYYAVAGQRVAMDVPDGLLLVLTDHPSTAPSGRSGRSLGSVVAMADASGGLLSLDAGIAALLRFWLFLCLLQSPIKQLDHTKLCPCASQGIQVHG